MAAWHIADNKSESAPYENAMKHFLGHRRGMDGGAIRDSSD